MGKTYKRKYWVNTGFQLGQAAALIVAHAALAMLIFALLSWFYMIVWDGDVTVNYNREIPYYIFVLLVIVTLVSVYFSLRRSRRIAGMMKKIHTVLDNAGKGRFPDRELTFRASDYFKELAVPLNVCLEQLRQGQGSSPERIAGRIQIVADGISSGEMDMDRVKSALDEIIASARAGNSN